MSLCLKKQLHNMNFVFSCILFVLVGTMIFYYHTFVLLFTSLSFQISLPYFCSSIYISFFSNYGVTQYQYIIHETPSLHRQVHFNNDLVLKLIISLNNTPSFYNMHQFPKFIIKLYF
jgi:hypothetical protein